MNISFHQEGMGSKVVLNLDGDDPRHVLIQRGGTPVAEITCDVIHERDALWAEVVRARRLEAIPTLLNAIIKDLGRNLSWPDHIHTTPEKKKRAFLDGVLGGLQRETVPHPMLGVPDILPDHTFSYRQGYEWGEALRGVVDAVRKAEAQTDAA